jgi:hypothetical protein
MIQRRTHSDTRHDCEFRRNARDDDVGADSEKSNRRESSHHQENAERAIQQVNERRIEHEGILIDKLKVVATAERPRRGNALDLDYWAEAKLKLTLELERIEGEVLDWGVDQLEELDLK